MTPERVIEPRRNRERGGAGTETRLTSSGLEPQAEPTKKSERRHSEIREAERCRKGERKHGAE